MTFRPVGVHLFHADGHTDRHKDRQTDMNKLIFTFRKFLTTPKNDVFSDNWYRHQLHEAQIKHKFSNKCLFVEKESGKVKKEQVHVSWILRYLW